ncbi:MAG: hypothetical protein KUL77_00735 [Thermomonas sp.]|uniref:hypothetical protein n=1 Tax=Thermomonas sp. TaxID=1971895 RepID=UPI001EB1F74A|nr:hypothetical protein [Thermomonas sp.]MBV2208075.1 hypothetical protein [Thermomonas sp.]
MLGNLRALLTRWFGPASQGNAAAPVAPPAPTPENEPTPTVLHVDDAPAQQPVAYDENLLERARTQWQFGDWDSLARLDRDILQHHPDRAKLALLAAAGRLQTHRADEARHFIRLAQDWGVSKKLMAQILAAGVHNSLGRAAALGNKPQRALQHFEAALSTGTPGSDPRLLAPTLARHEMQQLGLQPDALNLACTNTSAPNRGVPALGSAIKDLVEQLKTQNTDLAEQIAKQSAELVDMRKHMENTVKREMLNATQQLEAFLDIQNFFNCGKHLPAMHGWPISPDFARHIIRLLEKKDYDLIFEFGSGTSTVLIAKALNQLSAVRTNATPALQIAFEHLEKYHAQTLFDLKAAGLVDAVQLILSPLQPYHAPNGNTYSYYACHDTLATLTAKLPATPMNILMVVDGPPASTGKHARYPALPVVFAHFNNQHIDILLDDYARTDEREVGALWEKDFKQFGYSFISEKISMEKESLFISAHPL